MLPKSDLMTEWSGDGDDDGNGARGSVGGEDEAERVNGEEKNAKMERRISSMRVG
jgi:hypothetical protein